MWEQALSLDGGQLGWLSASERARWATLHQPSRRKEFIACRWALRQVLSPDAAQAAQWQLGSEAGQPPTIHASPPHAVRADWHLSLSHSGSYVACAAAPQPVGVDMELLTPRRQRTSVPEMASLVCAPAEWLHIQSLSTDAAQRACLLRFWSVKEAFFKCAGTGLDWAQLPRMVCIPWEDCSADLGALRAYARVWEGQTGDGQAVVLSVCMQQPLPHCDARMDADIVWHTVTDWALVQD